MQDPTAEPTSPRPRRTPPRHEPAPRPLASRPLPATLEDRVEVAVLGALGRLARRMGASPFSVAR